MRRFLLGLLLGFGLLASPALAVDPVTTNLPGLPGSEAEPNGTAATASPIASGQRIRATVAPAADVDFYKFTAAAGDKVFAATVTSGSSSGTQDSQLSVIDTNGTTVIEFDDDNGTLGALSSSIAGASLPAAGTYYLKVNNFSSTTALRYYDLYFKLRSGAAMAEVEPNDTPATATALGGGYVSGARNPASAAEQDWYAITLNAGDTLYASMDLDPERDGTTYNGRLGLALFGDAGNQILPVDDAGTGDTGTQIPSEFIAMTVKTAGTYYVFADSATAATGGPTATYAISAAVLPASQPSCRTYPASAPGAINDLANNNGLTTYDIPVADNGRIGRMAVNLDLTHAKMNDLDISLKAPSGDVIGLATDVGASATGGQQEMVTTFEQAAAIPPTYTAFKGTMLQPESAFRLSWFDGVPQQGTWQVVVRDDTAANAGTLNGASLVLCEQPGPPANTAGIFFANFESGVAGFTHSGTADEWERGTPATVATATTAGLSACARGTGCFKTDLDNTYDAGSSQNLISPPIDLGGRSGTITASWEQWFQMDTAVNDHATVTVEKTDGTKSRVLWDYQDGVMADPRARPSACRSPAAGAATWPTSPSTRVTPSSCASPSPPTPPASTRGWRSTTSRSSSPPTS